MPLVLLEHRQFTQKLNIGLGKIAMKVAVISEAPTAEEVAVRIHGFHVGKGDGSVGIFLERHLRCLHYVAIVVAGR